MSWMKYEMGMPKQLGELFDLKPVKDVCESRHRGNPQSQSAFKVVKPRLTLKQAVVLQYIRECGERGATTDEIAQHFDTNPNNVSGRISELLRDGKIKREGRRNTRSGCSAGVCKAL